MENGTLILSNGGYGVTERIPFGVSEKTLSTWVKLDDLNQRAGGAITLKHLQELSLILLSMPKNSHIYGCPEAITLEELKILH